MIKTTDYSITSSKTIPRRERGVSEPLKMQQHGETGNIRGRGDDELARSSNPSSVPLNSRSCFMMTQMLNRYTHQ